MDNLENNEEAEKYLELAKQAYDEENYEEAFNLFEKAAEQDITYAQRTIAWMYYYGEGVCQDLAKAKEWYDKFPLRKEISSGTPEFRLLSSIFGESKYNIEFQDIINNNSEASYRIGEMFHYGDYIKQDFSKAFEWFENAVKQGNDKAQNMIDILYKNRKQDSLKTSDKIKRDENLSVHNEFINKNISNEAKYMEVCKDNAIALCRFGFMYYSIEKDYSKAFKFFEKAAYCNEYAQRMLAWMYYYGEGVNQNLVKAKEWYDKFPLKDQSFHFSFEDIVVTKDTKAQYAVGRMFYYGNYIKKDFLKAFEWVEKAAKQGNTDAQNMLGVLYINGNGVRQDFLKARDWYLRAAINDNAIAQYNIGRMYYSGDGIETNYEEAFKWFEKSACHNYQYAKNMLGTLYKEGKGVAQDYFKAKEWYEKAGYFEPAQYNLSLMYFYGTGVQRDYQKAYELCKRAATKDRWGNIYIVAQKFLPKIKNYRTPLMEAAFSNSVSDAEELIKNKIDVDERNMMNRTALMFAADNNSLDVAKLLIKSGADVNAHANPEAGREFNGKTALIYAACNDSFDVAKLLIESGADVNVATNSIFHRTAFWFATINNSVKVAKLLIESGADIYYDIDEIIKTNSIDIVKLLITTRKWMPSFSTDCIGKDSLDMIKLLNNSGFTSKNKSILLFAAKKNYVDIVKYLIDLGVDVNTTTTYQTTLLMEAAINNAVDVAKFLINAGADLNAKNSANKTALKLAADNNSVKIVKMLIDAGAAINTTFQNSTEYSQLSHPSKIPDWPKLEFVSWLKEIDGKAEATAINYACQLGKLLCDYAVSKNLCGFTLSTVKEISAMHDRDKNATLRNAIKAYVRFLEYKGKSSIPLVFSPEDENLFSLLFSFVKKTKVIFYFKNKTKNERLWTDSWYKEFYDLRKYIYNSSFFTEIDYSDVEKIKFELDMNDSIIVQYMNFLELKRNAEQGNDVAQFKLGLMYENGKGIEQNYKKAIEWYKKAAEQGYVDAQFHLGNMYCIGLGVVQDLEKAIEWYKKAAEQGNEDAIKALEVIKVALLKTLEKRAEQGNKDAQYKLGTMYYNGEGVEQNYKESFCLYKKAAEQGSVNAQFMLGKMYYHGQGVERDYEKSIEWIGKTSKFGYEKAIDFFWRIKKKVEQSDIDAICYLGYMHYFGKGIKQDFANAINCFKKAAKQGNAEAIRALERFKKEDPFDSEDKIKLDNSVFTIDKTEEITTSRDAINWKKQKQEEKELYDEKIQSDVSLNTSDNADRTFFIKNVEIVSGNLINNNWQRKMQIIYTDKSDFIDNIPQFGGHDWSQDIGKSVEAIINESAGYYWLKFYKYKEELLRSNSYYEFGFDWKEKRQEEKEKNFSAFLEQRKQMIIEKTSRQATPNFYNKHENSNMKNNNSFLEKYTPNVIKSNLNKKIEESIQKSKILSSFVVIRSPLLQDGLLQFIKTDGSLLFANEKCMRNSCLPWTNKKIEFNIYKTEEGKITDWDWNYYEPTSVKQI